MNSVDIDLHLGAIHFCLLSPLILCFKKEGVGGRLMGEVAQLGRILNNQKTNMRNEYVIQPKYSLPSLDAV